MNGNHKAFRTIKILNEENQDRTPGDGLEQVALDKEHMMAGCFFLTKRRCTGCPVGGAIRFPLIIKVVEHSVEKNLWPRPLRPC
jgi:hypothetical protein